MINGTIRSAVAAACLSIFPVTGASAQSSCSADITGDRVVDGSDVASLLAAWGTPAGDIDGDSNTGGTDLTMLLAAWGPCGPSVPSWATLIEADPDPAIVTDATLRSAITATGCAWRVRDTATQIEMVLIPPGTFQMGCSASSQTNCVPIEFPVHAVTLTQPFYLGRYEVTQAQWTARMGSNPSRFTDASAEVPAEQVPNRPVEGVSWNLIQGFLSTTGMRLPTEAEWEYAYRAGTTTAFHSMPGYPSGMNDNSQFGAIAWFFNNSADQTRPVGQKAGNGFGLHDMSGNVWEWVNDWYSPDYYASSPSVNPQGPSSGSARVLRGGSWDDDSFNCRSSSRYFSFPSVVKFFSGFRVARAP